MGEHEVTGLTFGAEDVSVSRIVLVQAMSTELKERGFDDGDAALVPDDVQLAVDGQPGFKFVPIFWVKDRWWNPQGSNETICQGTKHGDDWVGRIVKGEPFDGFLNGMCWECPNAADVGHMNRPGPVYHGEWSRACTFRHNYPIRITGGLPAGVEAPPMVILSLARMVGKDSARFINTCARRDRGVIYLSEYLARTTKAKGQGKQVYWRWQVTRVGATSEDLVRELEPVYLETKAEPTLLTGPVTVTEAKYEEAADLPT